MVSKRPFHDEESYEIACKHLRQPEYRAQQSLIVEIAPYNDVLQKPCSDGEGGNGFYKSQDEGRIARDTVNEDLNGVNMESEIGASGSMFNDLSVNSNAIDEFSESEMAVHLSFFPNYFELDPRVRALVQSDDINPTFLDHPPQKLVSIGPDYQADIPQWAQLGSKNFFDYLDKSDGHIVYTQPSNSRIMDDINNGANLVGTCVIPMPDMELPAFNCCVSGGTGNNCNCLDGGSVRCVRQHVMEVREKLRENLGQKIFEELGFCDMGEEVAKKWSEDEEQVFHAVVLSNPASLGKNFWDLLLAIFPTRTMRDLVNYYFNVFMLRKRAEQNRFDPLNIDSDNDEWQRSELGIIEEDDDSVVESLADQDAPVCNQDNHEEDFLEGIENEDERDSCGDNTDFVNRRYETSQEDEGDIEDVSETRAASFSSDCGFDTTVFQLSGKISNNSKEDQDIQDDSCTSFEYQSNRVDSCVPVDSGTDARVSSQE